MRIRIEHLTKIYEKGKRALNDVCLEIGSGMFGLLGPNGAGKTTLMRILATLIEPTAGEVWFNGLNLRRNRREIRAMTGYLPQEFHTFPNLRTWEFLDYVASLSGLTDSRKRREAVDEMLEKVGLYDARDRFCNRLSGGMKRRLGIAQALIGSPKVIIVDEPTTGLDPEERIRFRNLLADIAGGDVIIILSTHIVGDISSTCSDMALLHRGEVVFKGAPEKLVELARGHAWRLEVSDRELEDIKLRYPVIVTIPSERGWEVEVVAEELDSYAAEPVEPNLEHAYVYFMEYRLRETVTD
ncbi:MAG: ABC transporter ATP-binding protein, partial [candidate division KSB1 bacterium]|nr:ABC transporter ATP-binding protein [candidate division KSB1 bacterium]